MIRTAGGGGAGLTFVVLEALGGGAAAPRVVGGLLAPVVPRVDVAAKLDEHLDEGHVLRLGRVVQGRLVQLRRVHVGPCGMNHQQKEPEQREASATREPGAERSTGSESPVWHGTLKGNPGPGNKLETDSATAFSKSFSKPKNGNYFLF